MPLEHCLPMLTAAGLLSAALVTACQDTKSGKGVRYQGVTYTYKVVDSHEIHADVYRYADEEVRPAIIWIHPGALIIGSRAWLPTEQLALYLQAGYTVVSIDHRLAPESKLSSIPDPFYNQRPAVSRERALKAIGHSPISRSGAGSSTDDRYQFYLYCRQQGIWPGAVSGHDPERERERYAAYEPLRNVTPAYPPTIFLHGQRDTDVPYRQSVLMAHALGRESVEYELITNPEWGHGFDSLGMDDPAVREAFERVITFLDEHVKK